MYTEECTNPKEEHYMKSKSEHKQKKNLMEKKRKEINIQKLNKMMCYFPKILTTLSDEE